MKKHQIEFIHLTDLFDSNEGAEDDFREIINSSFTYGDVSVSYAIVHRKELAEAIKYHDVRSEMGDQFTGRFLEKLATLDCDYIAL